MAQARREPRFVEMEVLAPAIRAPLRALPETADVFDADFETVSTAAKERSSEKTKSAEAALPPGIGLLKQNVPFDAAAYSNDPVISPGFAAFTAFLAIGVFWLFGGHALLY
jgi:hypothetical protein